MFEGLHSRRVKLARSLLFSVFCCRRYPLGALIRRKNKQPVGLRCELRTLSWRVTPARVRRAALWKISSRFGRCFTAPFRSCALIPAQQITIVAARDEATMRTLAPEEWGDEQHIRPSGLFHSDGEKDYVVLRLDAQGTTAYHTVYHEYTHALLHLNFTQLPVWLSEGVAEFFGNSRIGPQEARTGTVDKTHL